MEVSREQILRRMTVLKIKVEERLKLCHGDRVTPQIHATFRKDILEYIHEMEVCITKLELSHTPETDVLETVVSWASQLMEYHIELGGLDDSLAVPTASSFMNTSTSTSGRSSASFIVKSPQIQITGPTFGGPEMATDHMSLQNFLSRFENCVLGMANDAERLIFFLKCSFTDRSHVLLRTMWRKQFGWDDPFPPEIFSSWRELAKDLSGLSDIHFNRQDLVSGQPGDFVMRLRKLMDLRHMWYKTDDPACCSLR